MISGFARLPDVMALHADVISTNIFIHYYSYFQLNKRLNLKIENNISGIALWLVL